MNKNGPLFQRITTTTLMVLLVLLVVTPFYAPVGAQSTPVFDSDDFNRCSLNTSVWTFENPLGLPGATITGQYQPASDAVLSLTIPAGQEITFSDKNRNAPRIMQSGSDNSFEVEVKFASPLMQPPTGAWNIQGLLFRDTTSVPGHTRWLRFDLNSNNNSTHYYIAYIDENGARTDIRGPAVLHTQFNTSPLYLRVKYEKETQTWTIRERFGEADSFHSRFSFKEGEVLPGAVDFVVSGAGVFAGSTGTTATGFTSQIDYFRDLADTFTDDEILLTTQTVGFGTIDRSCSGNTVTLTAVPGAGASFSGWTGDVTDAQATIDLTMTQSYSVTANFTGSPLELPNKIYVPLLSR